MYIAAPPISAGDRFQLPLQIANTVDSSDPHKKWFTISPIVRMTYLSLIAGLLLLVVGLKTMCCLALPAFCCHFETALRICELQISETMNIGYVCVLLYLCIVVPDTGTNQGRVVVFFVCFLEEFRQSGKSYK